MGGQTFDPADFPDDKTDAQVEREATEVENPLPVFELEQQPERNVEVFQPTRPPVQTSQESVTLLSIISRAASDPAVNIDKMERLLKMHEQILAKQAEAEFNDAMNLCQAEMRPISADAENKATRSRYATYSKLDSALRPIYTKHGFSISFDEGASDKPDHIRVLAYVAKGAYTRTYKKDMAADGKGAKGGDVMTKTHAEGSAMSYGMRYLLKGIFNVAIGEEDDDGNAAGGYDREDAREERRAEDRGNRGSLNRDEERQILRGLQEAKLSKDEFCKVYKIKKVSDLNPMKYEEAMSRLRTRAKKVAAKRSAKGKPPQQ